jgi:hypothetical protein
VVKLNKFFNKVIFYIFLALYALDYFKYIKFSLFKNGLFTNNLFNLKRIMAMRYNLKYFRFYFYFFIFLFYFFIFYFTSYRMETLECLFLNKEHVWLEKVKVNPPHIDKSVLRKMVSWISRLRCFKIFFEILFFSKDFNFLFLFKRLGMAKKRMIEETYKAKKCIFHGLR